MNKDAPTQAQRKQRYTAHLTDFPLPVRVIGRNRATSKLWIKQRGESTNLVDESRIARSHHAEK